MLLTVVLDMGRCHDRGWRKTKPPVILPSCTEEEMFIPHDFSCRLWLTTPESGRWMDQVPSEAKLFQFLRSDGYFA
jgi:hypothetical protein